MLNILPREILIEILNKLENVMDDKYLFVNVDIDFVLSLRLINIEFNRLITSLKKSWKYIPYKSYSIDYNPVLFTNIDKKYINICKKRSIEVNRFCSYKNTPITTFRWLMDNNIVFSLTNICEIIRSNRIDVIRIGFHYGDFLNMLFNRFYMNTEMSTSTNDYLLSNGNYSLNPIIIAAENNNINIIKVLLECSIANPFYKEIPRIFDISIKCCYKDLLKYIVTFQYSYIESIIENKVSKILNRVDNCEDLFFYLLLNDKIKVTYRLLEGCIIKGYNELFKYAYPKIDNFFCHPTKISIIIFINKTYKDHESFLNFTYNLS